MKLKTKAEAPTKMRSIAGTSDRIGQSRGRVYRLIGQERLQAFKAGWRTLVSDASIEAYLASLPRATISMN